MTANSLGESDFISAPQRASVLVGIPKLLRDFGVSADAIRDGMDFDPRAFEDPEIRLPYPMVGRILGRCARLTGCEYFGLMLGAAHDHTILGLPGLLMQHSPTLGAALSGFAKLHQMNSQGATVYLRRFDDSVVVGYGVYERDAVGHEQIYPLTMALAFNAVRALTASAATVTATEVHFAMRPPVNLKPFTACFRAPLLFNQAETGLVLPGSALDAPVIGAKASELERLRKIIAAATTPSATPWSERVRHAMKPLLLRGEPTASAMAAHLDLSLRTLTRRLTEEKTGFQSILEEVRFTAARELLALTDLAIGDIAEALSYAAHAPFVDAFRRWAGSPPSVWRAEFRARIANAR